MAERIDLAIEVTEDGKPGLVHYHPVWVDSAKFETACGIEVSGMVLHTGTDAQLTCEQCQTEYVAARLRRIAENEDSPVFGALNAATGAHLDMIAKNWFSIQRHPGEPDSSFRFRLRSNLK